MMDVSSAAQWWDEWQMRILVLGSLGMRWFLLPAAPMRAYGIPWWFKTCIRMAYLGSDALAIYALTTLFNRHAKATNCDTVNGMMSKASVLEVLWAPVLLIHLGGQEMTLYNIEEIEKWRRKAITLASKVTVALYTLYKWWPSSGDRNLLAAAILLFAVGIVGFSQKRWALKRATIDSKVAVSSLITIKRDEPCPCGLSDRDKLHMMLADMSLESVESELSQRRPKQHGQAPQSPPRTLVLQQLDPTRGMGLVHKLFGLIYTKDNVLRTPANLAHHLLLAPSLHIAVITLLAVSQRNVQNVTDLKVTYLLLCFTAALDIVAVFLPEGLKLLMEKVGVPPLCGTVAQYNLIDSALRRMEPVYWLMERAGWLLEWAEKIRGVHRVRRVYAIARFIVANLPESHSVRDLDIASYRIFSEHEGDNWALSRRLRERCRGSEIEKSLQVPFDKSVLLWHIATDLCLRRTRPRRKEDHRCALLLWLWHIATDLCFRRRTRPADAREKEKEEEIYPRETCIEAISNYMAYLLNFRPDMLMTGSRQHLFTEASREVKSILKHSTHPSELDPKSLAEIISRAKPGTDYYLIPHACSLAEALLDLRARDGEDTMWEVMECVWEGMLCYSAGMCRGYLHAKTLGEGGEFLSFVWFILSLMGVRTLADKLQLPEKARGQDEPTDGPVAFPDEVFGIPES